MEALTRYLVTRYAEDQMNNSYFRLFQFRQAPLTRYRWRNQDFADLQDNGLVAMIQGLMQGQFQGAVLQGMNLTSTNGLNFTIASGFAVGPTGDLMYLPTAVTGTFPSPTAGPWGARSLAVVRPLLFTPPSGFITPPTVPLTTAPLFVDHYAQLVVLDGQNASGLPPATGSNDVILFGVRMVQNATGFQPSGAEYIDRDYPGRRSSFAAGHLLANAIQWDDRVRPYKSGLGSIGIKPAQTIRGGLFYSGYSSVDTASIFPANGALYNGDAGDTFLNFTTGALSGADLNSANFFPTIPSAYQFIWGLVTLGSSDKLAVSYGTQGTYLQCLAAYKSQVSTGAGAIPVSANFKVAYVLLGSIDGGEITELDVYDARGLNQVPGTISSLLNVVRLTHASSPYAASIGNDVFECDCTSGNIVINLPARSSVQGKRYDFSRVDPATGAASGYSAQASANGSDTWVGGSSVYLLDTAYQAQVGIAGTTNWLNDNEGD